MQDVFVVYDCMFTFDLFYFIFLGVKFNILLVNILVKEILLINLIILTYEVILWLLHRLSHGHHIWSLSPLCFVFLLLFLVITFLCNSLFKLFHLGFSLACSLKTIGHLPSDHLLIVFFWQVFIEIIRFCIDTFFNNTH